MCDKTICTTKKGYDEKYFSGSIIKPCYRRYDAERYSSVNNFNGRPVTSTILKNVQYAFKAIHNFYNITIRDVERTLHILDSSVTQMLNDDLMIRRNIPRLKVYPVIPKIGKQVISLITVEASAPVQKQTCPFAIKKKDWFLLRGDKSFYPESEEELIKSIEIKNNSVINVKTDFIAEIQRGQIGNFNIKPLETDIEMEVVEYLSTRLSTAAKSSLKRTLNTETTITTSTIHKDTRNNNTISAVTREILDTAPTVPKRMKFLDNEEFVDVNDVSVKTFFKDGIFQKRKKKKDKHLNRERRWMEKKEKRESKSTISRINCTLSQSEKQLQELDEDGDGKCADAYISKGHAKKLLSKALSKKLDSNIPNASSASQSSTDRSLDVTVFIVSSTTESEADKTAIEPNESLKSLLRDPKNNLMFLAEVASELKYMKVTPEQTQSEDTEIKTNDLAVMPYSRRRSSELVVDKDERLSDAHIKRIIDILNKNGSWEKLAQHTNHGSLVRLYKKMSNPSRALFVKIRLQFPDITIQQVKKWLIEIMAFDAVSALEWNSDIYETSRYL